jgi:hypothetical protein
MDAMSTIPSARRKMSISTVRNDNFAQISVSDAGPGVPPEKLKRFRGKSGSRISGAARSVNDPTATLGMQCGNGFHGYRCARLNRYDAVT